MWFLSFFNLQWCLRRSKIVWPFSLTGPSRSLCSNAAFIVEFKLSTQVIVDERLRLFLSVVTLSWWAIVLLRLVVLPSFDSCTERGMPCHMQNDRASGFIGRFTALHKIVLRLALPARLRPAHLSRWSFLVPTLFSIHVLLVRWCHKNVFILNKLNLTISYAFYLPNLYKIVRKYLSGELIMINDKYSVVGWVSLASTKNGQIALGVFIFIQSFRIRMNYSTTSLP